MIAVTLSKIKNKSYENNRYRKLYDDVMETEEEQSISDSPIDPETFAQFGRQPTRFY